MHWGVETCRSFFIRSGIKYIVPLLVICCKYMQNAWYTVSKTKTSAFTLNVFYNGTSPPRQMAVALLVKEYLIVYEIQWFITVGTRLCRCMVTWASWIQSTPSRCFLKNHFNILFPSVPLSPYMSLNFRIPPKICVLFIVSIRSACCACLIRFAYTNNIWWRLH
jgi:hypothetical protein